MQPDGTRPTMELHDRNGQLRNQHHLQAESSVRGNADHKTTVKERHRISRCRKSTHLNDDHKLNHHIPNRKVYGQKFHGPDCARRQRQAQEISPEDCRMNHSVRKNTVRVNHLEDCTARSEHYGHYEPSGHHARKGRSS